ncbi:MAG TPA: type II toxin-antitoxin system RelE/ParE family toxin [Candidatus Angelobacter sp.]|nr:type II toxin-antitoxin system RelE/ParE family toxin [Candidatus Angelobacter sp.]
MAGWQAPEMIAYQFTSKAVDDLFEIWSYIARDNPAAADAVEDSIYRSCTLLAQQPLAGRVRTDLTPLPLRFWFLQPYSNYVIVYDPATKPLQIIRLLHGARNIPSLLP